MVEGRVAPPHQLRQIRRRHLLRAAVEARHLPKRPPNGPFLRRRAQQRRLEGQLVEGQLAPRSVGGGDVGHALGHHETPVGRQTWGAEGVSGLQKGLETRRKRLKTPILRLFSSILRPRKAAEAFEDGLLEAQAARSTPRAAVCDGGHGVRLARASCTPRLSGTNAIKNHSNATENQLSDRLFALIFPRNGTVSLGKRLQEGLLRAVPKAHP